MSKGLVLCLAAAFIVSLAPAISAQARQGRAATPAPQAPATSDIYHVHFNKALPGQARALADQLRMQNPKAPMPGHYVVLRHQDGDDWDYCVIEHLGTKATIDIPPPPANATPVSAWHEDTFVAGPSWNEFARAMGLGAGGNTAGSVYEVATWRQAPGHRVQLQEALMSNDPASKIQVGRVLLTHLEGGAWTFLAINRYNSWQDYAANETASVPKTGSGSDPWSQVRDHSTFHRDTLADRIAPK